MFLRLTVLLSLAVAAALILSCGGGGPEHALLEERGSPTPTLAPIFQRSPVAGTPAASPALSPAATPLATTPLAATPTPASQPPVDVTPVAQPFQVTVSEAVNVRDRPSTEGTVVGGIYPGDKATVVGEARGQAVEPGKGDLWYQVELTRNGGTIRGFAYASNVERVE